MNNPWIALSMAIFAGICVYVIRIRQLKLTPQQRHEKEQRRKMWLAGNSFSLKCYRLFQRVLLFALIIKLLLSPIECYNAVFKTSGNAESDNIRCLIRAKELKSIE